MCKCHLSEFGLMSISCWAVALMSMVLVTGCGSNDEGRASVRGKVTLNGEPVDGGRINFTPTGGGPQSGGVIREGEYDIPSTMGVAIGENRVEIRWTKETGRMVMNPYGGESLGKIPEAKEAVPSKYHEKSTLTAEIVDGENEFDFDLEGEPTRRYR